MPPNETSLAEKHLGIIAARVLHYWWLLPPRVRAYFDAEDMISEVVLQVVKSSGKFDPLRSRETTFVWWVANNHCLTLLHKLSSIRYQIEEVLEEGELSFAHPASGLRLQEALAGVERILQELAYSSDSDLGEYLDRLFSGKPGHWPQSLRNELLKRALRHGVSYEDFRLVLAAV